MSLSAIVACILLLGLPFAQLRTFDDRVECCCPDPAKCKCPDHDPDHEPGQTSMRACHKSAPDAIGAQLATFVAPPRVEIIAPSAPGPRPELLLASPHAPPAPRRPDAPS